MWLIKSSCFCYLAIIGIFLHSGSETPFTSASETKQGDQSAGIDLVLLGATGNLAEKYLWQSIYDIVSSENIDLRVFPAATRDKKKSQPVLDSILEHNVSGSFPPDIVKEYTQLREESDYEKFSESLKSEEPRTTIFYLSVPPKYFGDIVKYINSYLRPSGGGKLFVVLEKPFGSDLKSAEELSQDINAFLKPEEVLIVDHYMWKAGVEFSRDFFQENAWSKLFDKSTIAEVEISMLGDESVKGRTGFYQDVGVFRDVMQNHLMMMASTVGVFRAHRTKKFIPEDEYRKEFFDAVEKATVMFAGQYEEYETERDKEFEERGWKVDKSLPEPATFGKLRLQVKGDHPILGGVPVYLVSGKALNQRSAGIAITMSDKSVLFISLQGPDGLYASWNTKKGVLSKVKVPSSWAETEKGVWKKKSKEVPAYEGLFRDLFNQKTSNFVSLKEVLRLWEIFDEVVNTDVLAQTRKYRSGASVEEILQSAWAREDL